MTYNPPRFGCSFLGDVRNASSRGIDSPLLMGKNEGKGRPKRRRGSVSIRRARSRAWLGEKRLVPDGEERRGHTRRRVDPGCLRRASRHVQTKLHSSARTAEEESRNAKGLIMRSGPTTRPDANEELFSPIPMQFPAASVLNYDSAGIYFAQNLACARPSARESPPSRLGVLTHVLDFQSRYENRNAWENFYSVPFIAGIEKMWSYMRCSATNLLLLAAG